MKKILFLLAAGLFAQMSKYDGYTINAIFAGIDSALVTLKAQAKVQKHLFCQMMMTFEVY